MKKSFLLALVGLALMAVACHDDVPSPTPTSAQRTAILYMMAENSLSSFTSSDLAEIEQARHLIPADCNLLVYVDDVGLPRIYQVTAEGIKVWKSYEQDHNSTSPTVMLEVMNEMVRSFPAHHYAYILWSHGTGWVPQTRTIGIDNERNTQSNSGSRMDITALRTVLEHLPHADLLMFDACAMMSIEVAYELRHCIDLMLGSPAEIYADGAPYHKVLQPLMAGDYLGLAKTYYAHYDAQHGVALALIDCRKLQDVAQATAQVLPALQRHVMMYDADGIQQYMPYTSSNAWCPEPYDIEGAMHRVLEPEAFDQWRAVLHRAIPFRAATRQWVSTFPGYAHTHLTDTAHYAAVSMFIPQDKYVNPNWNDKFTSTQWYRDAGFKAIGWPKQK